MKHNIAHTHTHRSAFSSSWRHFKPNSCPRALELRLVPLFSLAPGWAMATAALKMRRDVWGRGREHSSPSVLGELASAPLVRAQVLS